MWFTVTVLPLELKAHHRVIEVDSDSTMQLSHFESANESLPLPVGQHPLPMRDGYLRLNELPLIGEVVLCEQLIYVSEMAVGINLIALYIALIVPSDKFEAFERVRLLELYLHSRLLKGSVLYILGVEDFAEGFALRGPVFLRDRAGLQVLQVI